MSILREFVCETKAIAESIEMSTNFILLADFNKMIIKLVNLNSHKYMKMISGNEVKRFQMKD